MNIANKIVVKMGQSEKMLQKIKSDHVSVIHEVLLKSHQETKDLTFICGDGQIVEVSRTVVCLFSPFITQLLQEIPSYLNKVISLPDLSSSDMKQIIEILNFFLSSKRTDQKNISKKLVDVANNLLGLNLIYEVIIDVNSHVDSENGANEINKNGGHDSNFEKKKTLQIKPLSGLSMNSENICEQPTVEKEINSSKTDTTQQNVANTIIKQSTVNNHSSIAQSQVINVDEISDIPRSMSPVTRSLTPMQRSMTPMQRFMTPVQRSMNPMQRSMNPMQRSMTPMQRSMTPMLNSMSPMPRSLTPGPDWTRPMTPMPRLIAPMSRPMTPMPRSMTPIPRPTSPLVTPASLTSGPITSMVQPITSMVQPVASMVGPMASMVGPMASMVGPMASIVGPMTSPVIPMTSMVGPMTTMAPIYTNGAMHVQRAIASPSGQLNAIPRPMNPMLRPTGSMIGPNSLQLPMNPMMMKNMPRPMHILPNSMNPPKLFNHVNNLPRPVIATNLLTRPMNPPMPIQSPVNLMNNIHRPSTESQAINGEKDLDILSIENEGEVDILPNQANEFNLLPKSGNEAPVNPDNETLLYKATNEAGFSKILNFSFKGFEENKLVETLGKIIKYQIPNSLNSRIRIDILKHNFGNKTDNSKKSLENKSFILIPDRRKHKFQVTSVNTSDAPDVIKRSESLSNVPTSGLSTFSNSTKFPLQKNPDDEKLDNQKKTNDDANKKLQGALCENSTTTDLDSSEDSSVSRTVPIENNEYHESKMETNSYEDGGINKLNNPKIDDDTPDSIDTGEKYKSSKNDISDRGNHIGEKSKSISNDVFSEDISRKNYSEGSITRKRKISENTTTTNKKTNVNPVDDGFAICFFLPLGWMYKQSKGEYRAPNGTLFNTIKDVYKSLDESNAKERTNDNTKCDEKSLERDSQLIKIKKDSKDNITAGENEESNGHYKNMDDLLDSDSEPEDDYISSTIELEEDATVLKNNENESQLESNTDVTKNFTDVRLITKEPVQEEPANTEPLPDVENREAQLNIESGEQQIDSDSDKQYPDVDSDDQQLDTDNLEHLDNDDDEQQLNMESDEQQLDEDSDEEQLETESEEDRRLNGTNEQLLDSDSDDEDVEFADDDQLDIDSNEKQVDIDDDRESLDISGNGDGKTLNVDSNDLQPNIDSDQQDINLESNEQQLDIEGEGQQMNNESDETQLDIENDFSDSESDNDDEQSENDNEFSDSDTEIGQNDSTEDKNNTDVRNEVGSNENSNPESDDVRLDIDNDNDDFSDSEDDEEDGLTDHERSETIEENNENITDDEEDDFSDSEPSETIESNNEIDENMMEIKSIKQSIMDLLKSK